jgi:hypothetical protein
MFVPTRETAMDVVNARRSKPVGREGANRGAFFRGAFIAE